jgi:hypothetical protein
MQGAIFRVSQYRFLPNPFQFNIHLPSSHSMLYDLGADEAQQKARLHLNSEH